MFVFEFAFNPAFCYRLAFRLLTQAWLPLLEVCRICDPWLLQCKSPKRSVAKIQSGRETNKAFKRQTVTFSSRV